MSLESLQADPRFKSLQPERQRALVQEYHQRYAQSPAPSIEEQQEQAKADFYKKILGDQGFIDKLPLGTGALLRSGIGGLTGALPSIPEGIAAQLRTSSAAAQAAGDLAIAAGMPYDPETHAAPGGLYGANMPAGVMEVVAEKMREVLNPIAQGAEPEKYDLISPEMLGQGLGSMAPILAASLLHPAAGALTGVEMMTGEARQGIREKTGEDRPGLATAVGVPAGALEYLVPGSFDKIAAQNLVKNPIVSRALNALIGGVAEGATETGQTALQMAGELAAGGEVSPREAAARSIESFVAGLLPGAALGGTAALSQPSRGEIETKKTELKRRVEKIKSDIAQSLPEDEVSRPFAEPGVLEQARLATAPEALRTRMQDPEQAETVAPIASAYARGDSGPLRDTLTAEGVADEDISAQLEAAQEALYKEVGVEDEAGLQAATQPEAQPEGAPVERARAAISKKLAEVGATEDAQGLKFVKPPNSIARRFHKWASQRGTEVLFYETPSGQPLVQGVSVDQGVIAVALPRGDVSRQEMDAWTGRYVIHEMSHDLRRRNSGAWNELNSAMLESFPELMEQAGTDVQGTVSEDAFAEERLARFLESNSDKVWRAILDDVYGDAPKAPTRFQKVVSWIQETLRDLFKKTGIKSAQNFRSLRERHRAWEAMEPIAKAFNDSLEQGAPRSEIDLTSNPAPQEPAIEPPFSADQKAGRRAVAIDDKTYLEAVKRGDTDTAQQMVDEAAKNVIPLSQRFDETEDDIRFAARTPEQMQAEMAALDAKLNAQQPAPLPTAPRKISDAAVTAAMQRDLHQLTLSELNMTQEEWDREIELERKWGEADQEARNDATSLIGELGNEGKWEAVYTSRLRSILRQKGLDPDKPPRVRRAQAAMRTRDFDPKFSAYLPKPDTSWGRTNFGMIDSWFGDNNVDDFRSYVQDKFIRVRRLQEEIEKATGQPVPEDLDVYLHESLMHGKGKERVNRYDKLFTDRLKAEMKKHGLEFDDMSTLVYARHALELNRYEYLIGIQRAEARLEQQIQELQSGIQGRQQKVERGRRKQVSRVQAQAKKELERQLKGVSKARQAMAQKALASYNKQIAEIDARLEASIENTEARLEASKTDKGKAHWQAKLDVLLTEGNAKKERARLRERFEGRLNRVKAGLATEYGATVDKLDRIKTRRLKETEAKFDRQQQNIKVDPERLQKLQSDLAKIKQQKQDGNYGYSGMTDAEALAELKKLKDRGIIDVDLDAFAKYYGYAGGLAEGLKKRNASGQAGVYAQFNNFRFDKEGNPVRATKSRKSGPAIKFGGKASRFLEVYDRMNSTRLKQMLDDGLITQQEADRAMARYDFYAPIRGTDEGHLPWIRPDKAAAGRSGIDVRGDILGHSVARMERATVSPVSAAVDLMHASILAAEKNVVGNKLLALVEEHPNPELWEVNKSVDHWIWDAQNREAKLVPDNFYNNNDNIVATKVDGQEVYITVHDARLAAALRNLGAEPMTKLLEIHGRIQRVMARLVTSYNPMFTLPNFGRDLLAGMVNVTSEGLDPLAVGAQSVPALRAILAVEAGKGDNSEYGKLWKQLKKDGGTIGFFGLADMQASERSLRRELKMAAEGSFAMTSLNRARKFGEFIERVNLAFENATRLSVYKTALDNGATQKQAASMARESTVNFNRKGSNSWMGPMYMFANAGIQGSTRMLRAARNPTTKKLLMAQVGVAYALGLFNRAVMGEDDDGRDKWDKWAPYVKERNWVFGLGGDNIMTLPAPYGANFAMVLGYVMESITAALLDPKKDVAQVASSGAVDIVDAAMTAFNPLGGNFNSFPGALRNLVPTVARPFYEIATNENFAGSPIAPTKYPGDVRPDSARYYQSVGPIPKAMAGFLNKVTGGTPETSGLVDISPESLDHLFTAFGGGLGQFIKQTLGAGANVVTLDLNSPNRVPIVNRFWQSWDPERQNAEYYAIRERVEQLKARRKRLMKDGDADELKRFMRQYGRQIEATDSAISAAEKARKDDNPRVRDFMMRAVKAYDDTVWGGG
jgi:hypothetical protein